MAGRLIKLNLRGGASVARGYLIAKINDKELRTQLAKLEYNAALTRNIRLGSTVQLGLDADAARYSARVVALDPKVDENLRTQRVRAILPNPGRLFVPGMFVKVQVDLSDNTTAIMIPTDAIVPVLKGKKVFLVKNGKAQEVMVTTGLRTDQKVQITTGLQPGDSLIVTGIMALKPGVAVKVK